MKLNMDISVLILFFNRPKTLERVFEAVRKAQPARLFLYQDGPRGEQDMERINECRQVVSNIDWECEVHRNFQTRNYGCDPSGFMAHRWAFSLTDKCVVLEDDVVPTLSYFRFCQELLNKYENDERVGMITGFNYDGISQDVCSDYFFTSAFVSMGWASWSRVVNKWEGDYAFYKKEETRRQLQDIIRARNLRNEFPKLFECHSKSGREFFETIFNAHMLLNSQLSIVSRVNMIQNVGLGTDSTHTKSMIETLPHGYRKIFTMQSYDVEFPLRHPAYVIDNVSYKERVYFVQAWNNPIQKIKYSFEELWLNLKRGNFSHILKSVINRINKILGRKKYS
ncbi:MAG: hemolysin activation protein [Bacteroidaceae bacterium]|nr:hemolysin activation protein [Bacteroidaceae bacterium]